jgi:hypothetical protein
LTLFFNCEINGSNYVNAFYSAVANGNGKWGAAIITSVGGAGNPKAQTIQPLGIGYVALDYTVAGTVKTVSPE